MDLESHSGPVSWIWMHFPLPSSAPSIPSSRPPGAIAQLDLSQSYPNSHSPFLPLLEADPQHQCSWPQFKAAQRDTSSGVTGQGLLRQRSTLTSQTYCSSILFINNESLDSKDGEEKCPHFPFEKQPTGDQNLKHSIRCNSLTIQFTKEQIQHWL